LRAGCAIAQEKAQTLSELWPLVRFLFEPPVDDERAWERVMDADAARRLEAAAEVLRTVDPWDSATLEAGLGALVERLGAKPRDVYQPLRVAITGTTVSPGIFESLAALGRESTLARVEAALGRLGAVSDS
jgi:glutamyl-tRNA synthetase